MTNIKLDLVKCYGNLKINSITNIILAHWITHSVFM